MGFGSASVSAAVHCAKSRSAASAKNAHWRNCMAARNVAHFNSIDVPTAIYRCPHLMTIPRDFDWLVTLNPLATCAPTRVASHRTASSPPPLIY